MKDWQNIGAPPDQIWVLLYKPIPPPTVINSEWSLILKLDKHRSFNPVRGWHISDLSVQDGYAQSFSRPLTDNGLRSQPQNPLKEFCLHSSNGLAWPLGPIYLYVLLNEIVSHLIFLTVLLADCGPRTEAQAD